MSMRPKDSRSNRNKCSALLLTLGFLVSSCGLFGGASDSDDTTATDTTTTDTTTTQTSTGGNATGALALSFPSGLNVGSAMASGATTSALTLQESSTGIETYTGAKSPAEKQADMDEILNATDVSGCFKILLGSLSQPACFAPNVQASAIRDNPTNYTIGVADGVSQLLYGDGGIVATSEASGEACTAATVNYFTEDALQTVDLAKSLFASLVCAGNYVDTALPEAGQTTNYSDLVAELTLPSGVAIESATIARDADSENSTTASPIYTTKLTMSFPGNGNSPGGSSQRLFTYFRHKPTDTGGRGHVIAMRAGIGNTLQQANQLTAGAANSLALQQPLPPAPGQPPAGQPPGGQPPGGQPPAGQPPAGQPPGGQPPAGQPPAGQPPAGQPPAGGGGGGGGGGSKIAVVALSYEVSGSTQSVRMQRTNCSAYENGVTDASRHPAALITADGLISLEGIAAIDSGNNFCDNIVDTNFSLNPSTEVAGLGTVGWAASLSDAFWRSFSYQVNVDSAGARTGQATFGFAPSYNSQTGAVSAPVPGLGMFCFWAQQGGDQIDGADSFLTPSGLSGNAVNQVQYQSCSFDATSGQCLHDAATSKLTYKIATDCGTGAERDLADIDSSGNITGTFTVPAAVTITPLGGVSVTAGEVNVDVTDLN